MPTRRDHDTRLGRSDWIHAAMEVLASDGLEAVRVENLAKKLGISKGSFYWHFRDRDDLLDAMLEAWESGEVDWNVDEREVHRDPAGRWASVVELLSREAQRNLDVAIFSWAREDEKVGRRASEIEKRRAAHLRQVFREIGFTRAQAEEWSETAMLVYLGWVDRATRDAAFRESGPSLAEVLSRFVLAASCLASQEALQQ
ncbi:MAG TPA: helix-turn-helix domain-containing protein [Candidatus Dormibacteraeota bacterium]|nr:helix-turn-helix domain-containing protein [Candidatus Dormibacteraeota bacterium]